MTTRILPALIAGLAATASAQASPLHVMLQGESAADMRALVTAAGGTLTHDLPIIDAVGAKLSRKQLDAILDSGEVLRFIDDLAIEEHNPESGAVEKPCAVAGAVEAQRYPDGLDWPLFNKGETSVVPQRIQMSWPPALGKLTSLELAGMTLLEGAEAKHSIGQIDLTLDEGAPALTPGRAMLGMRFELPAQSVPQQSEYQVSASFGENCTTKLVPGYPNNSGDFYYSAVTGAAELHRHGVRGAGITVAVLDSGLWQHRALVHDTQGGNRLLATYDAIGNSAHSGVFDESGHGTHLISALAHSGPTIVDGQPDGSFKGIAPDAGIVAIKAFNREGQGGMLDIIRGIQWALDHREELGIRVLNLSFAARPRWPYFLDPINQAVMRAWAAGVVVVAAAGNEGPEAMSVGSPGNLPYIITVGAVTDSWTPATRSDDYIPDFSSRGPTPAAHIKPDIVAPGGHITGVIRPGSSLALEFPEYTLPGGEFIMTGSSQAAAIVSGLVALLLELEPELTPDNVKCKFLSSAEPAINRDGLLAYSPFQQGHGYVSLIRAITLGKRGCGNTDLDIYRDLAQEEHFQGPAILSDENTVSLPGLAKMVSAETPAKGVSETRVWGVKDHIERLPPGQLPPAGHPFNWLQRYQEESQRIDELSRSD